MSEKHSKNISIADYTYFLPEEKIALFPLEERDQSKLLVYKNGVVNQDIFQHITEYLPENSILFFNNSKVIQARILFQKKTGSNIEIFCLEPAEETFNDYNIVMNKTTSVRWKCFVGGASKWKEEFLEKNIIIDKVAVLLKAKIIEQITESYIIEFIWEPAGFSFAEILQNAGNIPLPPYIKRNAENTDLSRYQTIYAESEGSVAAPTAGLHFTSRVFDSLTEKQMETRYVTLHVGAGTFKPVKSSVMKDHEMHAEWIDVDAETILSLVNPNKMVVAVGTTSLRTLESLYWLGVKLLMNPTIKIPELGQWEVYEKEFADTVVSIEESMNAILQWMKENNKERIFTQTKILISPGYQFKIAKALITNFHQPKSTLLLLVAAAIGEKWKGIYDYALQNDFRFLSYGDANLLFMAE